MLAALCWGGFPVGLRGIKLFPPSICFASGKFCFFKMSRRNHVSCVVFFVLEWWSTDSKIWPGLLAYCLVLHDASFGTERPLVPLVVVSEVIFWQVQLFPSWGWMLSCTQAFPVLTHELLKAVWTGSCLRFRSFLQIRSKELPMPLDTSYHQWETCVVKPSMLFNLYKKPNHL